LPSRRRRTTNARSTDSPVHLNRAPLPMNFGKGMHYLMSVYCNFFVVELAVAEQRVKIMSSYSMRYQYYCQFFLLHKVALMYSCASSILCSQSVCQSVYPAAITREQLIEFLRNLILWNFETFCQHDAVSINIVQNRRRLYLKSICGAGANRPQLTVAKTVSNSIRKTEHKC